MNFFLKVKPSDPFGFSGGSEAGPGAEWINDCCVLNLDEKPTNTNFGKHTFFLLRRTNKKTVQG